MRETAVLGEMKSHDVSAIHTPRTPRWPGATLRGRLMALSIAALIPGFVVVAYTEYRIDQSRKAEVRTLALNSAQQAAYELDRILLGVRTLFIAMARSPVILSQNADSCGTYLKTVIPDIASLASLSVVDRQGQVICGTALRDTPLNIADRDYFLNAMKQQTPVLGTFTIGRGSNRPVLPVAMAIRDAGGTPVGAITTGIDLDWLGAQLRERGLPQGGSITVADRNGTIVAREPTAAQFVGTTIPFAYRRLLTAPGPGVETVISQDGTARVLGYVPVQTPPDGLYVSVGLSVEQSYAAVNRAARVGALLAVIAALGTLAVTWIAGSRVFVVPLQNLKSVLERWRAGERAARTGLNADEGEIGALGATLDRLMDEIASSQEQRELLSNELAHRVKNTLTIVQAIAVLTMSRRIPAQEALPDFLSRITALGRTNDVLTRSSWDRTALRDLIIRVAEPLSPNAGAAFRFDGPNVDLPPQEALGMTMVLHELCTNALKYGALSRPGGMVLVDWAWREPSSTTLDIVWRERGGPRVEAPQRGTGFGTRLIARALGEHGSTSVEFSEHGLICRIELTIAPQRETPPA
eukprot:gene2065-2102_t